MYDVIKKADEYGLNKVFLASREFVQIIEELSARCRGRRRGRPISGVFLFQN